MIGELTLASVIGNVAQVLTVGAVLKQRRRKQLRMCTEKEPKKLPFIDKILQEKTSKASKLDKGIATRLTKAIRWSTNTKAFEYVVLAFVYTRRQLIQANLNSTRSAL